MNQQNQVSGTSSQADTPLKRKRGRPRKDEATVQVETKPAMQAPESLKNNKQCVSVDTTATVAGDMVGQLVTGVIEGAFDDGYLLKVKVGDTDTYLRGVVFRPGRFIPITAANDVAPQAKMITRTEMPIPVPKPPAQIPLSIPSSEQGFKNPVQLVNLGHTVKGQGLISDLQSNVPIAQEKKSSSGLLSISAGLPMSYTGPSLGNTIASLPMSSTGPFLGAKVVPQQNLGSVFESRPASLIPQVGQAKVAQQDDLLKELGASIAKDPNRNKDVIELSESVPQSAPSVNVFPGTETVNLEHQSQIQNANDESKPNELVHDGLESGKLEKNQTPVVSEPSTLSSIPVSMGIWMEKQGSADKAAPSALAMEVNTGGNTSNQNGRPATQSGNITEADPNSAALTNVPTTLLEREAVRSASKLAAEGSSQKTTAPQFLSSLIAASPTKADAGVAPTENLPMTLFERESILSGSKLETSGSVLPGMAETQFFSLSGAAGAAERNIKDSVPATES